MSTGLRLEEIRRLIPLASVIEVNRGGFGDCPRCGSHATPALKVYDDHFHCFACGFHGDVVDYVAERDDCTIKEAAKCLAAQLGLSMSWGGAAYAENIAKNHKINLQCEYEKELESLDVTCEKVIDRNYDKFPAWFLDAYYRSRNTMISATTYLRSYMKCLKSWKS